MHRKLWRKMGLEYAVLYFSPLDIVSHELIRQREIVPERVTEEIHEIE
jgi:hypothetical protein